MVRLMKMQINSNLVWKRGEGWIQFNPPRSHPSYQEWQKLKQKHKEKQNERTID